MPFRRYVLYRNGSFGRLAQTFVMRLFAEQFVVTQKNSAVVIIIAAAFFIVCGTEVIFLIFLSKILL